MSCTVTFEHGKNTLGGNGQWFLLRIYLTEVTDIIYKLNIYSLNWKLYSGKDMLKNKAAWYKIQLSKYYILLWRHCLIRHTF